MSAASPPPSRTESTIATRRAPAKRWWLMGLTVLAGLLLGATLVLFFEREAAPGGRSVPDLIKAARRQDTWWDGLRSRVWPTLPGAVRGRFPGLHPISAAYVRQQACAELANLGSAAASATLVLVGALDDPRPEVQLEAIRALGAIGRPAESAKTRLLAKLSAVGGPTNVPLFRVNDFLGDLPSVVRKLKQPVHPWTAYVSGQLSVATRQALMEHRESISDSEALAGKLALDFTRLASGPLIYEPGRFAGVRWRAVTQQRLAQRPHGAGIPRLNRLLLKDALELTPGQDFAVLGASERLFEVAPPPRIPGIGRMGTAATPYWPIRESVVAALPNLAPDDPDVVSALLDAYEAQQEGAGRSIYELIRQSRRPGEVFAAAVELAPPPDRRDFVQALALGAMPSQEKNSVLTGFIDNPDAGIQFAAVGMLGRTGAEAAGAVPALTNLLGRTMDDRRPASPNELRQRVIVTLGAIGPGARAALSLLETEYRDPASPWRREAALARWRIDDQCGDTLPILAEGLKDPDMSQRRRTLEWLTEVTRRRGEGLAYLLKGLEDPEDILRVETIAALSSFGPQAAAAVPALAELSAHAKHFVSLPAQRALEAIQGPRP